MLGDVLMEIVECVHELDFSIFDPKKPLESLSADERRINMLSMVLRTLNKCIHISIEFKTSFVRYNGIEAHLRFLRNDEVLNKILDANIYDIRGECASLVNIIVLNLSSLTLTFEDNAQLWNDSDALDVLIKVSRVKSTCQLDAYIGITNIATDKQIETLPEILQCITSLSDLILRSADDFSLNRLKNIYLCDTKFKLLFFYLVNILLKNRIHRQYREIFEDGKIQEVSVHCVIKNNVILALIGQLRGLYKLAVNDKLRSNIYFRENFKNSMIIFLEKGNQTEQMFTLRLLCQLSFNFDVAKDLKKSAKLNEYMSKTGNYEIRRFNFTINT